MNNIKLPKGNNLVLLRSDTIWLVQNRCSFHGVRSEDLNQHLKDFFKFVVSLNLDVANRERRVYFYFPFAIKLATGLNFFQQDPSQHRRILPLISLLNSFHREGLQNSCEIDHTGGGKLCDKKVDKSWEIIENLALYDHEGWNDSKDHIKPAEVREGQLIGPELVQENTEKISQIKDMLKAARDHQKSYVNKRRKALEVSVGDYVLLKVSPWKGVVRLGKKRKLAPKFIGPFEIAEKVGLVAYRLDLPEELDGVHDTFYVSNLKKFLADPTLQVPLDEIQVDDKLNFMEDPVEILERELKKLKRSRIAIVKVQWNSKRGPKFTWERED
nr:putative reverse transcriptase domain-containing protein [Tanacetum cinerariifolium]